MRNDIEYVINLYSTVLSVKNETYNKRVGMFNQLVENFISKLFKSPNELVFEYNLKFSTNLLVESVSSYYDPINNIKIVDWILEKIDNGSGVIKEQYNQEYLDSQEYYYTTGGKLVQGKKNAGNGGVPAKKLYPDVKDLKTYPASIDPSYVFNANNTLSQQFKNLTDWAAFEKQLIGACQKNPTATNVSYKSSDGKSLKNYFCHDNWCNINKDKRYDPNKQLCKNNTSLAKLKEMGWDGFFEKLRELLLSAVGAGVQIVIDFVGGGIAIGGVWLLMLLYDAGFKPQLDWVNIVIDIIGVLSAGLATQAIGKAFQAIGTSTTERTIPKIVGYVAKNPNLFKPIEHFLPTFENLFIQLTRLTTWILEKLGTAGGSMISKLTNLKPVVTELMGGMSKAIANKTGSEVVGNVVTDFAKKKVEKYATEQGGEYIKNAVAGSDIKGAAETLDKNFSKIAHGIENSPK
jgi:hypothetical protein